MLTKTCCANRSQRGQSFRLMTQTNDIGCFRPLVAIFSPLVAKTIGFPR
jgi:hypothetical protein